jgi:hypothetical protein
MDLQKSLLLKFANPFGQTQTLNPYEEQGLALAQAQIPEGRNSTESFAVPFLQKFTAGALQGFGQRRRLAEEEKQFSNIADILAGKEIATGAPGAGKAKILQAMIAKEKEEEQEALRRERAKAPLRVYRVGQEQRTEKMNEDTGKYEPFATGEAFRRSDNYNFNINNQTDPMMDPKNPIWGVTKDNEQKKDIKLRPTAKVDMNNIPEMTSLNEDMKRTVMQFGQFGSSTTNKALDIQTRQSEDLTKRTLENAAKTKAKADELERHLNLVEKGLDNLKEKGIDFIAFPDLATFEQKAKAALGSKDAEDLLTAMGNLNSAKTAIAMMSREEGSGALQQQETAGLELTAPGLGKTYKQSKNIIQSIRANILKMKERTEFLNSAFRRYNTLKGADESWTNTTKDNPPYIVTETGDYVPNPDYKSWKVLYNLEDPTPTKKESIQPSIKNMTTAELRRLEQELSGQ